MCLLPCYEFRGAGRVIARKDFLTTGTHGGRPSEGDFFDPNGRRFELGGANDAPEHNHNPVGRVFYAASTCICVPASLAHSGPALGAQAGEAVLKNIILASGFTRFRRATQTAFNMVLEARP